MPLDCHMYSTTSLHRSVYICSSHVHFTLHARYHPSSCSSPIFTKLCIHAERSFQTPRHVSHGRLEKTSSQNHHVLSFQRLDLMSTCFWSTSLSHWSHQKHKRTSCKPHYPLFINRLPQISPRSFQRKRTEKNSITFGSTEFRHLAPLHLSALLCVIRMKPFAMKP